MKVFSENMKMEFLLRCYFDLSNGYYKAGLKRAYLDFNRTLSKGEMLQSERDNQRVYSQTLLEVHLKKLIESDFYSQEEFDKEHEQICQKLKLYWSELKIGHCQKWINMTLKYWLVFGENKIKFIDKNHHFFHVPIDNLVLNGLISDYNLTKPWSKIDTYKEYLDIQHYFRKLNPEKTPIVEEIVFFNKTSIINDSDSYFKSKVSELIEPKLKMSYILFESNSPNRIKIIEDCFKIRSKNISKINISNDFYVYDVNQIKSPLKLYQIFNENNNDETTIIFYDDILSKSQKYIDILVGALCYSIDSGNKWPIRFEGQKEFIFKGKVIVLTKMEKRQFLSNLKFKDLTESRLLGTCKLL